MILIDMPMPEKCSECRFETEYWFCKAMPDNFCGNTKNDGRPQWCPLKEQEPKPYPGMNYCPYCGKHVLFDEEE